MKKSNIDTPSSPASKIALVVCCAGVLWATSLGAKPQTAAPTATKPAPAVRLVSAKQGRAIVDAAFDVDASTPDTRDCSHLVHEIYSRAGYEYPYASSFELYAGHAKFRRVRYPQPGDLVTWPGHVGIVLEPRQHTFYSLVRSGLQAEDYQGPYWRSRGKPRFYRYVVGPAGRVETAEVKHGEAPQAHAAVRSGNAGAVAQRDDPEPPASGESVREASERTPVPVSNGRDEERAEDASPLSVLISTEQRKPSAEEVAGRLSDLANDGAMELQTGEPLRPQHPVVIFDELRVERIEAKRDKGWVHLQIASRMRIAADGADFKRRNEKVRWELRRDDHGWTAIAPDQRRYVSRDAAVRTLAALLAQLTQSEAAAQHDAALAGQEARIVNLLSALLEK